ncbi:hypothetical protein PHLGIDRAFT_34090 [Phlebiopsis gigantea 11061_1 CR5-6]|uniref:Uncharacterized protein n=1 Tax=Phlebiopsis gigantea (strain 11061_1 CR5-6) TaxID=745531 RepID=A0A0C3NXM1_PHLG1|nr:hypothetical protein PHLGIDRAFT_34090 [Phlebiopsis gigantea 11061_1 CR5-6]
MLKRLLVLFTTLHLSAITSIAYSCNPALSSLSQASIAFGSCAASQTHFLHTMSAFEVGSPEWLSTQLTTLLASPHIHFTQPSLPGLKLRMGPGPIDVFSTRFANMCTKDVTGVLGGNEVDKEGLKEGLLALQKKWSADGMQVESAQAPDGFQVATNMFFTPKDAESQAKISVSASMREEGGLQRISLLSLDGDPSLFQ